MADFSLMEKTAFIMPLFVRFIHIGIEFGHNFVKKAYW